MENNHEEKHVNKRHAKLGKLIPGQVDIRLFRLLSMVCVMHSPSIKNRREACESNGVAQSYFSVKYRHMQMVSHTVAQICNFTGE